MSGAEVPEVVRRRAEARGAASWLDRLPALVTTLERRWGFTTGSPYPDATEAFVAPVELAGGTPAVLKVAMPDAEATRHEITVLQAAGGDGCAALLRADADEGAMLLERLGRSLHDAGLGVGDRHGLLCAAASRLWRPAAGLGLPTGADKAAWLRQHITTTWARTGRPCSRRVVDHAGACAERRRAAHRDERAVLVHGDVHQWNLLEAADGTWKLVDPDGLLAEAEYDLGVILREDPLELLDGDPRERAHRLAAATGRDAAAAWEWGVVERVSTGLLCERIGLQPVGRQMLAAAERIAASFAGVGGGERRRHHR